MLLFYCFIDKNQKMSVTHTHNRSNKSYEQNKNMKNHRGCVTHAIYHTKKNYGMSEVVISYQFLKCHHRDRCFFFENFFFLFVFLFPSKASPGIRRFFLNTTLHVIFAKTTLMLNE